jgi:hypothetical protein
VNRLISTLAKKNAAMDPHIARLLNDKLYDKRKTGALEYVYVSLEVSIHPFIYLLIYPPTAYGWTP